VIELIRTRLMEKIKESLSAVAPIVLIVVLLALFVVPVESGIFISFLFGSAMVIVGMVLFGMGADMSMSALGESVGKAVVKSRKLWVIVVMGFILGFIITVSEPDLQVLAGYIPSIPNLVLILFVAAGVGLFLCFAFVRIFAGIPLTVTLFASYAIVFVLTVFMPKQFMAIAFDSGGVTTGPMTVPFIMALGVGISSMRSDRHASEDSFGLIALCSVGPIISVMAMCLIFKPDSSSYELPMFPDVADSVALRQLFGEAIPHYIAEMALAIAPIALLFLIMQLLVVRLDKHEAVKIGVGMLYTYAGLVLFLTGANSGFMPAGVYLGKALASLPANWIIVPLGMLIGYYIVMAEPAVYVLMRQVEQLTNGAVTGKMLKTCLSVGVAVSVGLAMLRVLTGLPILYLVVPGYGIALLLSFFVPPMFTAIAFDSGGVASGPMTATFLLPLAIGACSATGGSIFANAFGVVAMVAMTPLITIQILGLIYKYWRPKLRIGDYIVPDELAVLGDYDIIEL